MDDSPVNGPLARACPSLCCDVPVPEATRLRCQQHLAFMSRQRGQAVWDCQTHLICRVTGDALSIIYVVSKAFTVFSLLSARTVL